MSSCTNQSLVNIFVSGLIVQNWSSPKVPFKKFYNTRTSPSYITALGNYSWRYETTYCLIPQHAPKLLLAQGSRTTWHVRKEENAFIESEREQVIPELHKDSRADKDRERTVSQQKSVPQMVYFMQWENVLREKDDKI